MTIEEYKKLSDLDKEKLFPLDKQEAVIVGVTLSRLNRIGLGTHVILPENLNIEELIVNYPPEDFGFDSKLDFDPNKIYLILGLLSSIPAKHKDLIVEDHYIPINAEKLNGYMTDYNSYLTYLMKAGVIEWWHNGQFYEKHSRKYRWTEQYLKSKFIRVDIPKFKSANGVERRKIIEQFKSYNESNLAHYSQYLTHWYKENRIRIDDNRASNYAQALRDYREVHPEKKGWNKDKMEMEYKSPYVQYIAFLNNLDALVNGNYLVSISPKVHRLYSVIVNMESEYRNFITYDGQKMVGIDIRSTQPYLLCLLLKKEFWIYNSPLPFSINDLPSNTKALFTNPSEILSNIIAFFDSVDEANFQEYINIVSTDIYDDIVNWVIHSSPNAKIIRDVAKEELLMFFNAANSEDVEGITIRKRRVEKYFSEKFPRIMELIKLIKSDYEGEAEGNSYNRFSYLLQSIESEIILHRCCKRIWEEKPAQVPIFTIHDCIATTLDNENYVKNIMEEELTRAVGISPRLKREEWDESKLPAISEPTSDGAELDRVNTELERLFPRH